MTKLKISKEIALPLDIVTQTIAILAKRRAGKSYTMRKLVEQLLVSRQQVVLVDPKGDQWGIRSSADGKRPGYPIVILGGEHGDAPLEVSGGEVVAKLVVEERVSVLLDLSQFRKHEVATFMTAFLENLYRLKAQEQYRTPVMLVIDEADAIAPQKPQKGEERMLGAAEDIVRRGGQRGIGCALITQRSAVLNKNVLTQAQMLIVLRTIAPQDLAAMKAWVDVHGTIEQGKELMDSLPSLPIGDAWFWSPGWPTEAGIFTRSHVLPIETFDSGATPAPGAKVIVPRNLADVDLEALKKQMAATIEKAKNDDPRNLRKRISELERENTSLKTQPKSLVEPKQQVKEVIVKTPVMNDRQIERLEKLHANMLSAFEIFAKAVEVGRLLRDPVKTFTIKPETFKRFKYEVKIKPSNLFPKDEMLSTENIAGPEQRILNAIAWLESIGVTEPEGTAVAFLAGYTYGGGGFNNPKGALRSKGLIEYKGSSLVLTHAGRNRADAPSTPLTTRDLHEKVLSVLGGPEQRVLKPLLEVYPNAMPNEVLASMSGYTFGSGGFNNPKGRLRSLGLIEYVNGGCRARDILFLN